MNEAPRVLNYGNLTNVFKDFYTGKLGPGKSGSSKLCPGKSGPGKSGPGKLGPGKLGPWIIWMRQIVLYIHIGESMSVGIGYILPTIGEYMFVEFMYWYWIYSANNWGIYVS